MIRTNFFLFCRLVSEIKSGVLKSAPKLSDKSNESTANHDVINNMLKRLKSDFGKV